MKSAIEQYLESIGYIRHRFDGKDWVEDIKPYAISSVGAVAYRYKKRGCIDVMYGLNEYGRPATVISPRPVYRKGNIITQMDDDTFSRATNSMHPSQLYQFIQKPIYEEA